MKKVLLIFCSIILFSEIVTAQESKMKYVYSLDEALQKAKKENKLIFFNCFADWVITCHGMDKQVFSNEEFADYMDKNFVNLFLDVVLPENKYLTEKYKIDFFAHYLILDSDGEIVHRIVGGAKLPMFQENVALALNPKTSLRGLNSRYEAGENNVKFYRDYMRVLILANEDEKYKEISMKFFEKLNKKDLPKAENWTYYRREVKDEDSEFFKLIIEKKAEFVKHNSLKTVNGLISNVYSNKALGYAAGAVQFTENDIAMYRLKLNKANLPEDDLSYKLLDFAKLRLNRKYAEMITFLETKMAKEEFRLLEMLDYSFKDFKNLTAEQKKIIIDYLNKVKATKKGSAIKSYDFAISQVEEFKGIEFFEGTFEEAKALAKKEGKLIFFDGYTSWCGPCKTMAANVFTVKEVGLAFNEKFINVKMDMERGEGIALAKTFKISSYPTMLLINSDGEMVHKIVGGCGANEFMTKIMRGTVKETSYAYLKNNYEANKDNVNFRINYYITMADASELSDANKQISDYLFSVKNIEEIANTDVMKIVVDKITDYRNPLILKIVKNSDIFKKKIGEEQFAKYMERMFFPVILDCIKGNESNDVYIEAKGLINQMKLSSAAGLTNLSAIYEMCSKKEIEKLLTYYETNISKISDAHTKMNLDLIIPYFIKGGTVTQQAKAKLYIENCLANCDSRAKRSYETILKSLN